jgi:hypothetical protein
MNQLIWWTRAAYNVIPLMVKTPDEDMHMQRSWFKGEPLSSDHMITTVKVNWSLASTEAYDPTFKVTVGNFYKFYSATLGCDEKALNCLLPLIRDDVQIIDVKTVHQEGFPRIPSVLYILNPIKIIDCVDHENKFVEITKNSWRIEQPIYVRSRIKNANLFKTPENLVTKILATKVFKACVEANNLTGLTFEPVKESDK